MRPHGHLFTVCSSDQEDHCSSVFHFVQWSPYISISKQQQCEDWRLNIQTWGTHTLRPQTLRAVRHKEHDVQFSFCFWPHTSQTRSWRSQQTQNTKKYHQKSRTRVTSYTLTPWNSSPSMLKWKTEMFFPASRVWNVELSSLYFHVSPGFKEALHVFLPHLTQG